MNNTQQGLPGKQQGLAGKQQGLAGKQQGLAPKQYKTSRLTHHITLVLAIVILGFSLFGFGSKFVEFIHVVQGAGEGAFAIAPIVNYLLASTGFFCILVWAVLNGMLHDVEGPKYSMLEREQQLDRHDRFAE